MLRYLEKIFFIFVLILMFPAAFSFKFTVIINNPNNYNLTDYQIRIDMSNYTLIPHLKVADSSGNLLDFCYEQPNGECNTTFSKIIWIKLNLPANSNTTIYVYTNQTTNYAVTGDEIFDFYDDFNSGTLDTNKWKLLPSATYSVENGALHLYDEGITSVVSKYTPLIFETSLKVDLYTDINNVFYFGLSSNNEDPFDINTNRTYAEMEYYEPYNDYYFHFYSFQGNSGVGDRITVTNISCFSSLQIRKIVIGKTKVIYSDSCQNLEYDFSYSSNQYIFFKTDGIPDSVIDWVRIRKYADQEPTVISIIGFSVSITNKRKKEFVSKINITTNVSNSYNRTINTKIYYLFNNSLVYLKNITLNPLSSFLDSFQFTITKEGTSIITIKVYDPIANKNISDSFTFTLNLYSLQVNYAGYKVYNNSKYIKLLNYEIQVRCGALNHNITIQDFAENNYTVVCDNTTKSFSNSYSPSSEGEFNTWFYLNAVDPSDSRYFGNDTFIADLNPPEIITYYDVTPEQYLVTKLIVDDTISPVVNCTIKVNNQTIAKESLQKNVEYTWKYKVPYGFSILNITCIDFGLHKVIKNYTVAVTANTLKYITWDYPKTYWVGTKAKIQGEITIYNVGEYPIVEPVTEVIPFTYGENVKIYNKDTGEVIFEERTWSGPIFLQIKNLPAGQHVTYVIEYEIPTVDIVQTRNYVVVEGGKKLKVIALTLRSSAPIVLENVMLRYDVPGKPIKVLVNGKQVEFKKGSVIVNLGSFSVGEEKEVDIYYESYVKPIIPEAPEIAKQVVDTVKNIIENLTRKPILIILLIAVIGLAVLLGYS